MSQHPALAGETLTFPAMPTRLAHLPVPRLLRRFGTRASDLRLDFRGARAPLVTKLLELCGLDDLGRPYQGPWAEVLELGKRVECLLVLAKAEQARQDLTLVCPSADCGQPMELELDLEELCTLQHEAETQGELKAGDAPALRRPTGQDLARWSSVPYGDVTEAREALVRLLVLDDEPRERAARVLDQWPWLDEILAEADPLLDFAFATHCPTCARPSRHAFDLEAFALDLLAAARARLIRDVHLIASSYHWSERAILKLPAWRRHAYLALIREACSATAQAGTEWQS